MGEQSEPEREKSAQNGSARTVVVLVLLGIIIVIETMVILWHVSLTAFFSEGEGDRPIKITNT